MECDLITSRTYGRNLVFKTNEDRKHPCKLIDTILLTHDVALCGFTPMINHFHKVLHIHTNADRSHVMNEINRREVKWFSHNDQPTGHFCGDRFRSALVADDRHTLACLRYIDRNPVNADPSDHPKDRFLPSFPAYAHGTPHPLLRLRPRSTYLALAKTKSKRRALYHGFVLGEDPKRD